MTDCVSITLISVIVAVDSERKKSENHIYCGKNKEGFFFVEAS